MNLKSSLLYLFLLFSAFANAQSQSQILAQFAQSKTANQKNIYFKSLSEYYFKPYSLTKEQSLITAIQQSKIKEEKQLLQTIYISLLGIKGDFDKCNETIILLKQDNNLDEFLLLKTYTIEALNAGRKLKYSVVAEKFQLAIDLAKKLKSEEDIINAQIGLLYRFIIVRQPDNVLVELDKILASIEKGNEAPFLPKIYRFKSTCYMLKSIIEGKDYSKLMFEYSEKAIEYAKKYNDDHTLFNSYFSLGIYYSGETKDPTSAINNLLKSIEVGKKVGVVRELFLCYNYLIQNYIKLNDLENAEYYAKESLDFSKGLDVEEMMMERYYALAGIYLKKRDDKKVLEMIDSVRSSIITSYTKRFDLKYAELQTVYETSEKEKKIKLLDKENILKALVIKQQETILNQNNLKEKNRKSEIQILQKDKLILNQNNELLNNQNRLKSYTILNKEIELKKQRIEQENQQNIIDKLHASQKFDRLRNITIYSSIGLLLILSFALLLWFRYKQKQKSRSEKQLFQLELLESKLTTLRAQMNPHFMFNSINAVNNFILNNDKNQASKYLTKYAQLMRMVLEHSAEEEIPIHEEISMVQTYMELEQLRFNNSFSYAIQIDDSIDQYNTYIPPTIIQPFVENAICHGFFAKNELGKINISILILDNKLKISIDDNGIGRTLAKKNKSTPTHKSMGLDITTSRIQLINHKENHQVESVTYTDKYDEYNKSLGTLVEIIIPILN